MSGLPVRPSAEHLRKQAKRLARDRSLRLAEAQRLVARECRAVSSGEERESIAQDYLALE